MKKTYLAAILMAGILVSTAALCGCGNQQNTSAAPETTAAQATQAQTAAPAEQTTAAQAQQDSGAVDLEKAKSVALADAGFDASQVQFTKAQLETDDGIQKFEIEFTNGGNEYEYDINAQTGEIMEKSVEPIND